jgi:predicted porin
MFNLGVIYMKKSLVALAALAATGAFAQSSVTLYGRIDAGLTNQKTTTTTGGVSTSRTVFDLAGAQNEKTGARIGVTGVEDLGGGLKAGFVIESRVNIDKSENKAGGITQGTFGATRQANINLNGGFGTIVLGTYYNAFDDLRYAHSPSIGGGSANGSSAQAGGDGMTLGGIGAVAGATATAISERSENGLGYSTPSFGGFKIRASVISRKNTGDAQLATPTPGDKLNGFGLAAGYDNGPLSVLGVLGVAKKTTLPAGTQVQKVNDFGFNVKYDFGVAVPYFAFEQSKINNGAAGAYLKGRAIEVGAKFPLGAFTPYVTANFNKFSNENVGKGKATAFQIGTNYDISKRTSAYAAIGTQKSTDTTTSVNNSVKQNGVSLGLVHKF